MAKKHITLNKHVREFVKNYNNITTLELTDLIQSDDDYNECINHFSRRVYNAFAQKIIHIVNSKLGKHICSLKNYKFKLLIHLPISSMFAEFSYEV